MTETADAWNEGYATGYADSAKQTVIATTRATPQSLFTPDELDILSAALLYYLDELTPMARYRDHIAHERGLARELLAKVEGMRS